MSEREGLVQLRRQPSWSSRCRCGLPSTATTRRSPTSPASSPTTRPHGTRKAHYTQLLEADLAVVLLATDSGGVAGYAFAHLINEPDSTFDTLAVYAELDRLSVRPDARSTGIGTRLLDRLDDRLAEGGLLDLVVSVMSANTRALRFSTRRGLVPVETYLLRVRGGTQTSRPP